MIGAYLSAEALGFAALRLALAIALLAAIASCWRRSRPVVLLIVVVVVHLVAWAAYRAPLRRPYGLGEGSDRAFNLGMAAAVSLGHSPLEHTQVGHGSPEPFWNAALGLASWGHPERVPLVFDALTPLAIVALAAAAWACFGPRAGEDPSRAVVMVFVLLSLTSLSLHPRPPVPSFWVANFFYKPNHGLAFPLVVCAIALAARGRAWWRLGAAMGLLGWVFLLAWAYTAVALVVIAWVRCRHEESRRTILRALALSAVIVLPYVAHLLRDYAPSQSTPTAAHMWSDPRGAVLAVPNWSTLDLGLLLPAGIFGLWVARRRRTPVDLAVLGAGIAGWGMWVISLPLTALGVAPEPDELHYFLRFVHSMAAGVGFAWAGERLDEVATLARGRGSLLVLAALVPLAFPVYHDPPLMDRYYAESRLEIPPKVEASAAWIRDNVPRGAVFAAGRSSSIWIPALTGRRVLLAEAGKLLPADHDERKRLEVVLLTSSDLARVRAAAQRYGVTHLAIDEELAHEYAGGNFADLATQPWHRTVFANASARIVELGFTN